jgi:hypothetical protein
MYTSIKIRKETARKLAKLIGKLTSKSQRRISYDDLINYLIDIATKEKVTPKKKQGELNSATKKILEMMEQPIEGAGPEDFKEYDYNDVEG